MVALPLLVVWLCTQVLYFRLSALAALALSFVLSLVCAAVVSRIWERRSKAAEISFSELMIWSWYRLQKAERRIERGVEEVEAATTQREQLQVLHELTAALESKDPYTRGHSKRVERHSFKTGVAMGLPLADVEVLRKSASLHDVGKIRVPNKVLHKPGKLSPEERALIEEHPVLGAEMVASIGDERIVSAVRHHHERWDGHGYPVAIAGSEIPLFARVIAVADSYDAIRSTRSYRDGASRDEAVQIITTESGHQFDPEVVDAFLTTLPARGRAVAWLTSLATGPGMLWRFLERMFQRFGSTALAPVIGAAGTAIVIGSTSILIPPMPTDGYANERPFAAAPSPTLSGQSFPGNPSAAWGVSRVAQETQAVRHEVATKQDRTPRSPGGSGSTTSGSSAHQGPTSGSSSPTSGASTQQGPTSGSSTQQSPTSGSTQQSPTGSQSTSGAGTSNGDAATTGDPTDQGKDCKEKSGHSSKGHRLHCG
jgi:putative nucleotidyltransferase with HDIG domain